MIGQIPSIVITSETSPFLPVLRASSRGSRTRPSNGSIDVGSVIKEPQESVQQRSTLPSDASTPLIWSQPQYMINYNKCQGLYSTWNFSTSQVNPHLNTLAVRSLLKRFCFVALLMWYNQGRLQACDISGRFGDPAAMGRSSRPWPPEPGTNFRSQHTVLYTTLQNVREKYHKTKSMYSAINREATVGGGAGYQTNYRNGIGCVVC